MPIKIRQKSGQVLNVAGDCALEILDTTGRLAIAITQAPSGLISILTPGDPMFTAYVHATKQRASKVHLHEPAPQKPVAF